MAGGSKERPRSTTVGATREGGDGSGGGDGGGWRPRLCLRAARPRKTRRLPRALSLTDVAAVAARMDEEAARLTWWLYETGCRLSEALNLSSSDVDFNRCEARVKAKGRQRLVLFTPALAAQLGKDGRQGRLFPMRAHQYRRRLARAARLAGIPWRVTPHHLRHSFATALLDNGAPILAVSHLLGHAKVETTMRYWQLTGNREHVLRRAVTEAMALAWHRDAPASKRAVRYARSLYSFEDWREQQSLDPA